LINDIINEFSYIFIDEAHLIYGSKLYEENEDYEIEVRENDDDDDDVSECSREEFGYKSNILSYASLEHIKVVSFSATIDERENVPFFKISTRDLIDAGYLTPYTLTFPFSQTDNNDDMVCRYLVKDTSHIIVYTRDREHAMYITEKLNEYQNGCAEYVDCMTKKSKRHDIEKRFRKGHLKFLVNVRVYMMGFDAPITNGVCFIHLPMNERSQIQCIGRALRLHPEKKMANVIVPCSLEGSQENMALLLRTIADNDVKFERMFQEKKKGMIEMVMLREENDEDEDEDEEIKMKTGNFVDTIVFDCYGMCLNPGERWDLNLEKCVDFMDRNEKRPSSSSKNKEEKRLGYWISDQIKNYKKNKQIMSNAEIREKWEAFTLKYYEYFMSNEKQWELNLEKCGDFIDKNGKRPITNSKNPEERRLGYWISHQIKNYKKNKQIMSNAEIREKWESFTSKYSEYFMSSEEQWDLNLEKCGDFIDKNGKRPSSNSKNKEEKRLGIWISTQITNYKKNTQIMTNAEIREKWESFTSKYSEYFMSSEEQWDLNLEKCGEFIDEHGKRPSKHSKNPEERRLGRWISNQNKNYKKNQEIMSNAEIRNKWKAFTSKYSEYLMSSEEQWELNLEECGKFMDKNEKRPSQNSKNPEEKRLGQWISQQINNYKNNKYIMSNPENRKKWEAFTSKYPKYFMSSEEKWELNLEKCGEFMDENGKRPSEDSKNNPEERRLGRWISNQITNYKKNKQIMTNPEIREKWEAFTSKYSKYLMSNEEQWDLNLEKCGKFMDENIKRPSKNSKNKEEKRLGLWISTQITKYKKNEYSMSNAEIREKWEAFTSKYSEYFR